MADLVLPADLAVWDPLGGTPEPLMTGHDGYCIHTMAGSFAGTDSWFHRDGWGGTESTVGVAGSGYCKQWVPWNRQADANLEGNSRWLSSENADKGEGFSGDSDDDPPLTPAQLERNIRLAVYFCDVRNHRRCPTSWQCHREGIPARFIDNSCERGIGTHYHGIAGRGLVRGCPRWSGAPGKLCPRMVRHRQVRDIIVPETRRRLIGGFLMALTANEQREVLAGVRKLAKIEFMVNLLWELNVPNSFRWVDPKTFDIVPPNTPGAKPVFDVVRWGRESAIGAREEQPDHEAMTELLEQLQRLAAAEAAGQPG